jgi:sialate O-acetylesterase
MRTIVCLALVSLHAVAAPPAALKLHGLFRDNMVLQCDAPVPVWGTAEPGQSVAVQLGSQKKSAVADAGGRWKVVLDPLKAGGPVEMSVSAKESVTIRNVLIGEVWLCSGQSNMGWSVRLSLNPDQEIAAANYPKIRLFSVPRREAETPQTDVEGTWQECTPKTVSTFSAAAYFFGRDLQRALNVPIGLIHSSVGATRAQAWTSRPVLEGNPQFKEVFTQHEREKVAYDKAATKPGVVPVAPSSLYNGMIAPLVPVAIRGAIWYQGEGNVGSPWTHRTLFPALIKNWRDAWGSEFPFLYVQLAGHLARKEQPVESYWAMLRESQRLTLSVPKTAMATAVDIGDAEDIHPKNKQEVGRRLALAAEATVYGKDLVYSGPLYDSMKVEGDKIRLAFKHVGGGLVAKGESLGGFAIAGPDRKFVWAKAKIDGASVLVWSEQVPKPSIVQYAWADNPECSLYNKEGLPAIPFMTDKY